jgi:hypothetical protein
MLIFLGMMSIPSLFHSLVTGFDELERPGTFYSAEVFHSIICSLDDIRDTLNLLLATNGGSDHVSSPLECCLPMSVLDE